MHITSHSFTAPRRLQTLNTPEQPNPPAPQEPQQPSPPPEEPKESFGQKAFRVARGTVMGAASGALGGYLAQQGGATGTLGAVWVGLDGLSSGASCGWAVGKRAGLAMAGGNGEPVVKGIGALALTFGSPIVGGVAGVAAGIACATAGPLVCAGVMGGINFVKEMAS